MAQTKKTSGEGKVKLSGVAISKPVSREIKTATKPTLNNGFSNLSLKDLIEARDFLHLHLINKRNVVATAVGRYLIRKEEIDENGNYVRGDKKEPRTLENSVVIDISWPCILVFVKSWEQPEDLVKNGANDLIPKTVYMKDGRLIPICTVLATRKESTTTTVDMDALRFPTNYMGGGFPLIVDSQGVQRIASVGCLVTDGNKYYALTNKHVSGEKGVVVKTKWGNDEPVRIGISSGLSLGSVDFSNIYKGWNADNMQVNCDAGLVDIDDLNKWKAEIIGIGQMDEMYDLNSMNFTLGLITEYKRENGVVTSRWGKVHAFGAVSGHIKGEIAALFYRYKSVGGEEYVSDFLIRGDNGDILNVNHGDSGTVWLLEEEENNEVRLRPIALHWGQHEFIGGKNKSNYNYSLATCLSNVCRELGVTLVRGWNINADFSWGKVGHYTVGNAAVDAIRNNTLKQLMKNNLENISFQDADISKDITAKNNPLLSPDPTAGFCPLADVPDIIWKQYKVSADGTKGHPWGRKGDENPNHYADADAPTVAGKNLYETCDNVNKMTVAVWNKYYDDLDLTAINQDPSKPVSRGLVCFRVWQIFKYMTDAAAVGDVDRFVFAGGVLAHYVGDACQPLHSSYMSDGDPADNETIMYTPTRGGSRHPKGVPYEKVVNPGSGVHVAYEDHMIDDFIDQIFQSLKSVMNDGNSAVNKEAIMQITSGQDAAFSVLQLMKKTQEEISPKDIVEAYKKAKGHPDISAALYSEFETGTVNCLARGCRYLAQIWDAAWAYNGNAITQTAKVDPEALQALYADPAELPSMHLDTIQPYL